MGEQQDRDRSAQRSGWADALNPVENLREWADVQGFGRRIAEDLADRLLPSRDGSESASGIRSSEAELAEMIRRFRASAIRAGDAWASVAEDTAALVGMLITRLPRPSGEGPATDQIALVGSPGGELTGVFWIHNTSPAPVPTVRPHCAPLRSDLELEIRSDAIRFSPPVLDPLPARSSCGVEVQLFVPQDAVPGSYVSLIQASNVPGLYLPLRVTVNLSEAWT